MTRYAILSDIHANLYALESVLAHISTLKPAVDQIWCLGDLVVYGIYPLDTLDLLQKEGILEHCVGGNNDFAISQHIDAKEFVDTLITGVQTIKSINAASSLFTFDQNTIASLATALQKDSTMRLRWTAIMMVYRWTSKTVGASPEAIGALEILSRRSKRLLGNEGNVTLLHASPCEPSGMNGNYLRDEADAEEAFLYQETPLCFFGHTHLSTIFQQKSAEIGFDNVEKIPVEVDKPISLDLSGGKKALVNPGSVGQPRDGDWRSSYAVYDTSGTVTFYRVEYPVAEFISTIKIKGSELGDMLEEEYHDLAPRTVQTLSDRFSDADW